MLNEFREFIARGNVIDLAVAVVIGAAFGHYNRFMSHAPADAPVTTRDCPLCLSTIPLAARRCSQCTADLA